MFEIIFTLIIWGVISFVSYVFFNEDKKKKNNHGKNRDTKNQRPSQEAPPKKDEQKNFLEQIREEYQKAFNENSQDSKEETIQETTSQESTSKSSRNKRNEQKRNQRASSQGKKEALEQRLRNKQRSSNQPAQNQSERRLRAQASLEPKAPLKAASKEEKDPYAIGETPVASILSNRKELRKAIVTKEILDKPVSLRKRK